MGVATICLQTVIYISGRGSRKKQSYAMVCSSTSTFNLACGVRPEQTVKQDLDDPTRYLLTYTLLYSSL